MFRGARLAIAMVSLVFVATPTNDARAQPPRLEVEEVAQTGSMPKGVSISPDGARLYVTNFGQANGQNVTVFDAKTFAKLDTFGVPGIVVESVLSRDGKMLYVSNFERNTVQFFDLTTRRVTHEITAGAHPKILALSRDEKRLFAANWSGASVTEIDVETARVVRTLPAGENPRGMVVSSAGKLYIANFNGASMDVYSGASLSEHTRVALCRIPRHLALSPDEKTLYVSCYHDSTLRALDANTLEIQHEIYVGSSPKSVDVSKDGRYVFTADYGTETNSVSVVDTTDWTARVFPVPGMDRGSGLVVAPDGAHAFVTGWYDNHVYEVGFEGGGGHPVESRAKIEGWIHRPRQHPPVTPTAAAAAQ